MSIEDIHWHCELICQVCDLVIASADSPIRAEPRGACPNDPAHSTITISWQEEQSYARLHRP